jgi:uncharacterized protein (DUF433 family)
MSVAQIDNMMANGMSREDILREDTELEAEDIRQALSMPRLWRMKKIHRFASPAA